MPRVIEHILALRSYVNLRAVTSTALLLLYIGNPPGGERKCRQEKITLHKSLSQIPNLLIPTSLVLLFYGYFVQSQRHFSLEVQPERQGAEERVGTPAAPAGRLRLRDGTALLAE